LLIGPLDKAIELYSIISEPISSRRPLFHGQHVVPALWRPLVVEVILGVGSLIVRDNGALIRYLLIAVLGIVVDHGRLLPYPLSCCLLYLPTCVHMLNGMSFGACWAELTVLTSACNSR